MLTPPAVVDASDKINGQVWEQPDIEDGRTDLFIMNYVWESGFFTLPCKYIVDSQDSPGEDQSDKRAAEQQLPAPSTAFNYCTMYLLYC